MAIIVEITSPWGIAHYGYIHRKVFSPDADTEAKAKAEALLWLAQIAIPQRTLTLSIAGDPRVKRGDAIKLSIPDFDIERVVWVTSTSNQVSPGIYDQDIEVTLEDPYVEHKEKRIIDKLSDEEIAASSTTTAVKEGTLPKPPKAKKRAQAR